MVAETAKNAPSQMYTSELGRVQGGDVQRIGGGPAPSKPGMGYASGPDTPPTTWAEPRAPESKTASVNLNGKNTVLEEVRCATAAYVSTLNELYHTQDKLRDAKGRLRAANIEADAQARAEEEGRRTPPEIIYKDKAEDLEKQVKDLSDKCDAALEAEKVAKAELCLAVAKKIKELCKGKSDFDSQRSAAETLARVLHEEDGKERTITSEQAFARQMAVGEAINTRLLISAKGDLAAFAKDRTSSRYRDTLGSVVNWVVSRTGLVDVLPFERLSSLLLQIKNDTTMNQDAKVGIKNDLVAEVRETHKRGTNFSPAQQQELDGLLLSPPEK